jgi:high-affinity Fe2+/Pb2+ permease
MLFLAGGLGLASHGLLDEGPRSPSQSPRVRAIQAVFGARGTEVIGGLVLVGLAAGLGYLSLEKATPKGKAVVGIALAITAGLVVVARIGPSSNKRDELIIKLSIILIGAALILLAIWKYWKGRNELKDKQRGRGQAKGQAKRSGLELR